LSQTPQEMPSIDQDVNCLPRVLVVNTWPFNRQTNMGQTLHSLFQGYPRKRLACVDFCPSASSDFPDATLSWRMGRPILDALPTRIGWHRLRDGENQGASLHSALSTSLARRRGGSETFGPFLNHFAFKYPGLFSGGFGAWISNFRPQVVFSQAAPGHILPIVMRIASSYKAALVSHITDDWVSWYPQAGCFCGSLIRLAGERSFRRFLSRCDLRLAISESMAREYERRYGLGFGVVMNPSLFAPRSVPCNLSKDVVLRYTGVLEPLRWRVLVEIGKQLDQLPVVVRLEIFCPSADERKFRGRFAGLRSVVFREFVPADRLASVLETASVLVFVESDSATARTKLALSTKIGSYLAAGRPIIAIGPRESASIEYLHRLRVGPVLNDLDTCNLRHALRKVLQDQSWVRGCVERAHEAAKMNHHGPTVRSYLWNQLATFANRGSCSGVEASR
jgi:glycosyltransferase involved in cell wall biosynthesis